jgi:hypothetical protein
MHPIRRRDRMTSVIPRMRMRRSRWSCVGDPDGVWEVARLGVEGDCVEERECESDISKLSQLLDGRICNVSVRH